MLVHLHHRLSFSSIVILCGVWALCWFGTASSPGAEVILVKIFVDEEEATVENVWRKRLSERLMSASRIIEGYSDVRFAILDFGTWQSDNRVQDLSKSLREFEQEVDPGAARIAIGFSSQYKFQTGRNNLGGTRGPMRSHILIRENAQSVREPERLEVLVHELGHFLCAAHSAAKTSVMRPVVGDGQARATSFRIGFDPINAKIIRLTGREMRDRHVERFEELSPSTLRQLRESYLALAKRLPADPTAARYLQAIDTLLQMQPPLIDPGQVLVPILNQQSN